MGKVKTKDVDYKRLNRENKYEFTLPSNGKKIKLVKMGDYKSGLDFFYRMNRGYYHMPIAVSEWCIYHEVYSGPFIKTKDVYYPKWAPKENDKTEIQKFLKRIDYSNKP